MRPDVSGVDPHMVVHKETAVHSCSTTVEEQRTNSVYP